MEDSVFTTILAGLATYWFVGLIVYVLLVVAEWKYFVKAGEAGWKSLIPVYNMYIQFKITWGAKYFWIWVGCVVLAGVGQAIESDFGSILASVFNAAQGVILLIQQFKLSKAFGHGIGFAIGLILIPNVFTLIIGLGKSEYKGVQA